MVGHKTTVSCFALNLLATSNPDTTEIIDSQTSMNDAGIYQTLFSGIYGFNFPQTSLGKTFGGCNKSAFPQLHLG